MTHVNRQNIGKFWAIPRKGTKYLAVSSNEKKESIPLIVVIRDILKIIRNKKELQKSMNEKKIKIENSKYYESVTEGRAETRKKWMTDPYINKQRIYRLPL